MRRAAAAALAFLSAAAAMPASAADPETEQRLAIIDSRLTRVEGILDNKVLLDMLRRVEALQRELQALREATDLLGHDLRGIQDRQRELYLDVDRRLRALESQAATGGSEAPAPQEDGQAVNDMPPLVGPTDGAPIVGDEPPDKASRSARDDDAAYGSAFDLLKAERYQDSIAAFKRFLADYPQSMYAANAQYWLAEASYVSGEFERAAAEFNKVIEQYPTSSKVPDAKLKLGFTHYELQQWEQARSVLSELNKKYPNTAVAQLAENRLERMSREGH